MKSQFMVYLSVRSLLQPNMFYRTQFVFSLYSGLHYISHQDHRNQSTGLCLEDSSMVRILDQSEGYDGL